MADLTYDCLVLGTGPGGYVAAIRCAQLGLKTACVEKEDPGGVCLNWGCIPTKALLKSAEVYSTMTHAQDFGVTADAIHYDFPAIVDRSRKVVDKMTKGVSFLLRKNKIDYIQGAGQFTSPHQLTVTGSSGEVSTVSFRTAIIATGARPRSFPNLPIDGKLVIGHRTALELKTRPAKLLVIGAGAIGAEFAYFYNSFGTEVTLVEMMNHILPVEDEEVSQALAKSFQKKGIRVHTSTQVASLTVEGASVKALLTPTGQGNTTPQEWVGDLALVAVGMEGNSTGLGLEALGISIDRSFISVNEFYQTSLSHIYAIGDVIGPPLLAHVASHEGIIAAEHLSGHHPHALDYSTIPACTYCKPQVASIGLAEKAARNKGYEVNIGRFPFSASGRAVASGETEGFVKVVVDKRTEEVLGVHIIHPEASELIGEAAIIRSHEGVASSVINSVHAHPTLTEAIMEAMGDALGRAIHI